MTDKPLVPCRRIAGLATLALTLSAGCAVHREYTYRPSAPALADVTGFEAGVYQIPPERPEGEVRVLSFGITYLEGTPGPSSFPTLHARLIVANNGDASPWTLDTSQVSLDIAGEGSVAPMYANTDQGSMPRVTIGRGERRIVDLYFPVPGPVADAERLPAFDVKWQVETSSRAIAERTPFARFEIQPQPNPQPVMVVAGWGPFWWLHPHYPRAHVFVHAPVIVVPGPRRVGVVVRPRRHR